MNRMIYFLHIHKSGGSTFVNLAKKNGEKFYDSHKNGNPYDSENKIIKFWNYGKEDLLNFLDTEKFTFCANEFYIKDFHLDSKIKYVTVLRHPIDILLSSYHHESKKGKHKKDFKFYLDNKRSLERMKSIIYEEESSYFSGPLVHYLACGKSVDLARERLRQFDAIIFVDNYQEDIKVMKDLAGWDYLDVNSCRIGTNRNTNAKKELNTKMYKKICRELESDILLYNEVKAKTINGKFMG